MQRLPSPPWRFAVSAIVQLLPAGTRLWRIYFRGRHAASWGSFRAFGPTASRFDHHTRPKRVHPSRKILYATNGPHAIETALAEVFQDTSHIDRHTDKPRLAAFELTADVELLDTGGKWPVRAGGGMAINSGSRRRAQDWSRAIYRNYSAIEGIAYPSSLTNEPCVALYERAEHAVLAATPIFDRSLADRRLLAPLTVTAGNLKYTIR